METTKYLYAGERAQLIRKELKTKYGWNNRQVSVRSDSNSIRVIINEADIARKDVSAIAEPHEKIRRDQFGDILSGGNIYLSVVYSTEALKKRVARYIKNVTRASKMVSGKNLIPIEGTPFFLGRDDFRNHWTLWNDSFASARYYLEGIAEEIGYRL